jgi:hypothetical protein
MTVLAGTVSYIRCKAANVHQHEHTFDNQCFASVLLKIKILIIVIRTIFLQAWVTLAVTTGVALSHRRLFARTRRRTVGQDRGQKAHEDQGAPIEAERHVLLSLCDGARVNRYPLKTVGCWLAHGRSTPLWLADFGEKVVKHLLQSFALLGRLLVNPL